MNDIIKNDDPVIEYNLNKSDLKQNVKDLNKSNVNEESIIDYSRDFEDNRLQQKTSKTNQNSNSVDVKDNSQSYDIYKNKGYLINEFNLYKENIDANISPV